MMHCGCGRLLLLVVGIAVQAPSNVGAAAADEYGPYGKCEEKGCGMNCTNANDAYRCAWDCAGEDCGSGCTGDHCALTCKGRNCGKRCVGYHCSEFCNADGCASECIGGGCAQSCKGSGCGRNCLGLDCAINCYGTGCGVGARNINQLCSTYTLGWHCEYPNTLDDCHWSNQKCNRRTTTLTSTTTTSTSTTTTTTTTAWNEVVAFDNVRQCQVDQRMDARVLDMEMVGIKVQRLDGSIRQWNLPSITGSSSSTSKPLTLRRLVYDGEWDGTAGPKDHRGGAAGLKTEPDYYKLLATGNNSTPDNNLYLTNDDDVTWEADCGGSSDDADGGGSSSSNPFLARDNVALGCTACVFVDAGGAVDGDVAGNGSRERPWKTLAHAEAAAGNNVDGVVLHGTFIVASPYTFRAGWSYTGYGVATTIYPDVRQARPLIVESNAFYRLVFDFSRVESDSSTFDGAQLSLHNVVIRHQRSDDVHRELLYYGGSRKHNCRLVLENVLLYDTEYNVYVYPQGQEDACAAVVGVVSAASNNEKNGGGKFALSNVEDVAVDSTNYKIIEDGSGGGGDGGYIASKKNVNVGVYAGKWSFDLRVVDNRGGDSSRRYQSTCIGTPQGLIKMGNGPENIGADHGVCMIGKKHEASWGFLVVKMWIIRPATTSTTITATATTTTIATTSTTTTTATAVIVTNRAPGVVALPQSPTSQGSSGGRGAGKSRAAAVAIPLTLLFVGIMVAIAYYYGVIGSYKRERNRGATNAEDELQQTHAIEMTENPLRLHRPVAARRNNADFNGIDNAVGLNAAQSPVKHYSQPDAQVQLVYAAPASGAGSSSSDIGVSRVYAQPDEHFQEMYVPAVPPDRGAASNTSAGGSAGGGAATTPGRKERRFRYVNHEMMSPSSTAAGAADDVGGAGAGAGAGYVNQEMVSGSDGSQLYAVPMEEGTPRASSVA